MQESLVPTFTPDQLRHNAKLIRKYLDSLGIKLTNSTALDVAANGIGYANYNIAKAALEKCEAEQKGNEYQFVTPKLPNPSGSTGQLQRIIGNTASGVVDLGPKIELSVFLYMYDNANLFIRNANDTNMVFLIKKDFVPDNAYDEEAQRRGLWFPKKGDRVQLVWKKPNTRTIPEIAPIEASATIVSVDDETRRRSLPQSTIIESIEYDPNVIYARAGAGAGAGAAFHLSDLPTGQLVQLYVNTKNTKAMDELIRRGMISSPEEFDRIKNIIDTNIGTSISLSVDEPERKPDTQKQNHWIHAGSQNGPALSQERFHEVIHSVETSDYLDLFQAITKHMKKIDDYIYEDTSSIGMVFRYLVKNNQPNWERGMTDGELFSKFEIFNSLPEGSKMQMQSLLPSHRLKRYGIGSDLELIRKNLSFMELDVMILISKENKSLIKEIKRHLDDFVSSVYIAVEILN